MPFGDMKYVLLDEADYITPNGQAASAWCNGNVSHKLQVPANM